MIILALIHVRQSHRQTCEQVLRCTTYKSNPPGVLFIEVACLAAGLGLAWAQVTTSRSSACVENWMIYTSVYR